MATRPDRRRLEDDTLPNAARIVGTARRLTTHSDVPSGRQTIHRPDLHVRGTNRIPTELEAS